jgi:hypothetical protein
MHLRIAWLALVAMASLSFTQTGGDKKSQIDAATCLHIDGALLQRTKDGFKSVKAGDRVSSHTLLVGLPEAELVSRDGRVNVKLLLYLGETLPVTEAAIEFQDSTKHSADIVIDRGIVALKAVGDKKDTAIRIRNGKETWEIVLKDPDSQVLVARFGRHEPGTKLFQVGAKTAAVDEPLAHLGVLVTKGHVTVNTGTHSYSLTAPPGPALMSWDSGAGYSVKHLDTLPDEVQKLKPADAKVRLEACDIIAKLVTGDLGKGLDDLVKADDLLKRRVGVACMGAFDDLPRLWEALENTKHRDVRDQAVLTLRNWMGRQPGHLSQLREHLTKTKKYSPAQARTITQLLKGFDERDRKEPQIYQLLIEALDFAVLPIRELAYWNLERLAPAGQKIAYDAAADEATRRRAVEEWRRLIPDGQLPPPPKKDEAKKGI